MHVDLETAKRLAQAGFPQAGERQLYWIAYGNPSRTDSWQLRLPDEAPGRRGYTVPHIAAPHPVDALEWLEREKHVPWRCGWSDESERWVAILNGREFVHAATAAELLTAVLAALAPTETGA